MKHVMSYENDPWDESSAAHPSDVQLQNFVRARGEGAQPQSGLRAHLTQCLICRVHMGRLSIEDRESVDPSFLASLTSESPQIDSAVLDALNAPPTTTQPAAAQVGQLWRAARSTSGSTALLVWIRKVFETTVAVLPATLDIELADTETLLVSAEDSPLNLELAVFSNIDTEIDITNLVTFIAELDIEADIRALRIASRDGAAVPKHLITGMPIMREDDQRIEYRHIVSELADSLYTESNAAVDDGIDPGDIFEILDDLSLMHPGLRVHPLPFDEVTIVNERNTLHPVAAVHHLATCVVVTALDGPNAFTELMNPALSVACSGILARFIEADSIAVCAPYADWETVLLAPMEMQPAIEVPTGHREPASVYGRPLDLNTMLLKHFEGAHDQWSDTSSVHFDEVSNALSKVAETSSIIAQSSVAEIRQKGQRATIPAKKDGYSLLSPDTATRISALISEVLAGGDSATLIDEFLDGQS